MKWWKFLLVVAVILCMVTFLDPSSTVFAAEESLEPTCEDSDFFGWIACGISRFITGAIQALIEEFLVPMLEWRMLI